MTAPRVSALWTADRATRALPLVRRIADDLVRAYAEWRDLAARVELAAAASAGPPDAEQSRLQQAMQRAAAEVEQCNDELAELGVECKSLEHGLFDFPSEREGRAVYLCWRRGEPTVTHWHELDAGFAGRQPL